MASAPGLALVLIGDWALGVLEDLGIGRALARGLEGFAHNARRMIVEHAVALVDRGTSGVLQQCIK